jgi:hypothetical protein
LELCPQLVPNISMVRTILSACSGCDLTSIGGIGPVKLGTHPLLLNAELDPEYEEDENENDEPSHLGDSNRRAKETGQNAGFNLPVEKK